ncbi:MAG TPA: hypothetical protein VGJ26_19195 [Pirellulales bacterium]|jgi:hypothetical protein
MARGKHKKKPNKPHRGNQNQKPNPPPKPPPPGSPTLNQANPPIDGGSSNEKNTGEPPDPNRTIEWDWWFAAVVAIATVVAAWGAIVQWRVMAKQNKLISDQLCAMIDQNKEMVEQSKAAKGQWEAANKQYKAMVESNSNAKQAAELELRPWLGMENARAEWNEKASSIDLIVTIKNSGTTPALAVDIAPEVSVDYGDVSRYIETPDPGLFGTGLVGLGASRDHIIAVSITAEEKAIFDSGDLEVLVEGCVEYWDAFESQHAFYFHFMCVTKNGVPQIIDETQIDDVLAGDELAFDFLKTFHEIRRENKEAAQAEREEKKKRKQNAPVAPARK